MKRDMIKNRKARSLFIMFIVLTAHTILLTSWLRNEGSNMNKYNSHVDYFNQRSDMSISPAANLLIDSIQDKSYKLESHFLEIR